MTIQELKNNGVRVKVTHLRLHRGENPKLFRVYPRESFGTRPNDIAAKGGITSVSLVFPSGIEVIGTARCYIKDPYNRASGREIALTRALEQIDVNAELLRGALQKSGVELVNL